ncbi:hypothetical protein CICLE_v10023139mg [Citrus x clementina]|uniref:Uncharacterized protein n=1 Tax=Citrus clementina TaxID=85681 RepID=V4VIH4_CITCL|nr:hypothetical protein CICLE_v10023139mg [Citrus x clementina]
MKVSGPLVAYVLAASIVALTSSSPPKDVAFNQKKKKQGNCSTGSGKKGGWNKMTPSEKEKFAPRFDGLRFIETLVTAHR